MAKTAIGLFENSGVVDRVVRDLEALGFPRNDVRVIAEPRDIPGGGVLATPHTDFEVDLTRDLIAFGVEEADAEDYVQAIRTGAVLVFATSSGDQAQLAIDIMNRHGAVEIEKVGASRPQLPNAVDAADAGNLGQARLDRNTSGSGARLFVW
ncbi:MAG: hypothetical protein WAN17_20540 [Candidatus Sulfotelmatobacter sp.]|jgi:hypothetical protein